ncbi:MAG: hypothetical protein ABIK92_00890 [Pseudomonadota bacterium]
MNSQTIISGNDRASLFREILGFIPLNDFDTDDNTNPSRTCRHIILPMEEVIAVGFGNALLTKNGECIYSEIETQSCNDYMTVAQAEELAAADPYQDWRIHLVAPFREQHYQRQGKRHWVLYNKGEGFA